MRTAKNLTFHYMRDRLLLSILALFVVLHTTAMHTDGSQYHFDNGIDFEEPSYLALRATVSIRLDATNVSGSGPANATTEACSTGSEILDGAETGFTTTIFAPAGIAFMSIVLTNPQDAGQEKISIGGLFSGVLVAGNGTTNLTLTNDGNATTGSMSFALDDLIYSNEAINPNTSVVREVEI